MPKLYYGGVSKATYNDEYYAYIYDAAENPFVDKQSIIGVEKKYQDVFEFADALKKNLFPFIQEKLNNATQEFTAIDVGFDDHGAPVGIHIHPKDNAPFTQEKLTRLHTHLEKIVNDNNELEMKKEKEQEQHKSEDKKHLLSQTGKFAKKRKKEQASVTAEHGYNTRAKSLRYS